MFIILEGTDGAGKSSLAREIATQFAAAQDRLGRTPLTNAQHIGAPKPRGAEQSVEDYADQEYERLLAMVTCYDPLDPDTLFIYDRFHGGGPTYGALYLEGVDPEFGQLGPENFAALERNLALRGAVTAYLIPEIETLRQRVILRNEGTDKFLDDASAKHQALAEARATLANARRLADAILTDPSRPVSMKMLANRKVTEAEETLKQEAEAARAERATQLADVRDRYIRLTTTHSAKLESYIGHPLYIDRAQPGQQVPPIGYSHDQRNVAAYLLHKARLAAVKASYGIETGTVGLPQLTPIVDCWGRPASCDGPGAGKVA